MRDLGSAAAKAVADYRERAIPDLVCHYHFLAAVGKKLLDIEYAALRSVECLIKSARDFRAFS